MARAEPEPDDALADAEHVRVVVEPRHARLVLRRAVRGTDALHLVRGDRHADAGPADQDAEPRAPGGDRLADAPRVVGVVHALARERAEVLDLEARPRGPPSPPRRGARAPRDPSPRSLVPTWSPPEGAAFFHTRLPASPPLDCTGTASPPQRQNRWGPTPLGGAREPSRPRSRARDGSPPGGIVPLPAASRRGPSLQAAVITPPGRRPPAASPPTIYIRLKSSTAFVPPKPNEFDMRASTRTSRAWFGMTSSGHSRILLVDVDGRREHAAREGEHGHHRLEPAGGAEQVARHRLRRRHHQPLLRVLAEDLLDRLASAMSP